MTPLICGRTSEDSIAETRPGSSVVSVTGAVFSTTKPTVGGGGGGGFLPQAARATAQAMQRAATLTSLMLAQPHWTCWRAGRLGALADRSAFRKLVLCPPRPR